MPSFGIIPHRFTKRLAVPAALRHLQCRLGERPPLRSRGLPRCAGGASAASNGATITSRATASPTSAISTGCPDCFPMSTSSSISAPIWRRGTSPIYRLEWRDGSRADRRALSAAVFSFSRGQAGRAVLFQQPSGVSCAVSRSWCGSGSTSPISPRSQRPNWRSSPHLEDEPIETIRKPAVGSRWIMCSTRSARRRALIYRGLDIVTGRAIAVAGRSAPVNSAHVCEIWNAIVDPRLFLDRGTARDPRRGEGRGDRRDLDRQQEPSAAGRPGRRRGRFFRDYDTALRESDADIVYLSLPNAMHEHWVMAALAAGKHVIVDKPAMITPEACERGVRGSAAQRPHAR